MIECQGLEEVSKEHVGHRREGKQEVSGHQKNKWNR